MTERHRAATDLGFAPWDVSFIANPYPVYRELRERHPVLYDEATNHWLVSRTGTWTSCCATGGSGAPISM